MPDHVDPLEAVFEHLVRIGDSRHGFGWREKVNRGLNRSTGYISNDISRRTMRVETLLKVLEILGEPPEPFFVEALRAHSRKAQLPSLSLSVESPTVPSLLAAIDGLILDERAAHPDFSADLLKTIAEKKLTDPAEALQMVNHALPLVATGGLGLPLAFPLLLEWSSIHVRLNQLREARVGYCFVYREAERLGCPRTRAETLLRLSTLEFRETASPSLALATANEAYIAFTNIGNRVGMGRALVKRSWYLHYLGQNQSALCSLELALELLPSGDKFTAPAHQAFGIIFNALDEPLSAKKHLEIAEEICTDSFRRAMVLWLRAEIAAKNGEHDQAAVDYTTTRDLLSTHSPVEVALVSLDLAHHHLRSGDNRFARDVIRNLAGVLKPLGWHPQIQRVVLNLIKVSITYPTLDAAVLREAAREIKRALGTR